MIQIVGGGAAGCEAAWGLATRGIACRLVTTTLDALYALPAEVWPTSPPAGTLWAALAAEVRDPGGGTRAAVLRRAVKRDLERLPALSVLQSNVVALQREGDRVVGVRTWEGPVLRADATVLAVGTFLAPRLRVGRSQERAGRLGEMAYDELRDDLAAAGARFVRRRLAVAADGVTPAHEVAFDAFDPEGTTPLRWDGRAVPGVRTWPGRSGLWLLGACAEPVDVDVAAAAGRDLAAHLAASGAPA
ncbi:MAG: FAD-dependent oxidoreductase [Trueperaceae bacterium]|nr:FAD-dependent oxidoreductase [Trueperaceae bacterium]